MRYPTTLRARGPRARSFASFGVALALALVVGIIGPGVSPGSASVDVTGVTGATTCLQMADPSIRFYIGRTASAGTTDSSATADPIGLVQDCMPVIESPVGVPMPGETSLEDPPAPPNIDDTVVPSNLMPRLDGTLVGIADNSNTIHPMPENECDARWHFDITKKLAPQFAPGNNKTYSYTNLSDRVQSNALSATRTREGSVGTSASAEIEVEAGAIVSSVKAKFGVTVSAEIGWSESITYGASVGAHKTGYLTPGVMRFVSVGHYYHVDCSGSTNIDKGMITVYSPWSEGALYREEGA